MKHIKHFNSFLNESLQKPKTIAQAIGNNKEASYTIRYIEGNKHKFSSEYPIILKTNDPQEVVNFIETNYPDAYFGEFGYNPKEIVEYRRNQLPRIEVLYTPNGRHSYHLNFYTELNWKQ